MTPEGIAYLPHLNALIVSIFLQHKRNFGCIGREPNDKSPAFVSIVITGNWEQFSIQNRSSNAKQSWRKTHTNHRIHHWPFCL